MAHTVAKLPFKFADTFVTPLVRPDTWMGRKVWKPSCAELLLPQQYTDDDLTRQPCVPPTSIAPIPEVFRGRSPGVFVFAPAAPSSSSALPPQHFTPPDTKAHENAAPAPID